MVLIIEYIPHLSMLTTLITGATAGIGKATAELLAKNKHNLILTGRREEKLKELSAHIGETYNVDVLPLCFDVRNKHEVKQALTSLPPQWQEIDVLINNAGLALGRDPIQEGNTEDWDTMIDTNVKGLLYVSQLVSKGMAERMRGHIVNLGSIAGKQVYKNGAVYNATKFAVEALTRGMRIDLLPYNIRVTSICPGAVDTEFSLVRFKGDVKTAEKVYEGYEPLHAEDIAEAIYFAISRPAHVCINDLLIMPTAQADTVNTHKS